jgi:N-acetylglucosaminyldiphosphoundecaprenol N-acetyl-beta-D-mannosaminyltransferase
VLTLQVSTLSLAEAVLQVLAWAEAGESRSVCAANVHMVMEAWDDPGFRDLVNGADLVTPDGVPLVWALRWQGRVQERVYGPDLMLETCRLAELRNLPIGLYGSREAVLAKLVDRLRARFPALRIVYAHSPAFRPLTEQETAGILEAIRRSGARILFVGLGCPKQERWMAAHREDVSAVMLGVGAAFDFHAGTLPQAPGWMQRLGLEWLFRLIQEPGRLWLRYLKHNPRFLALLCLQRLRRPPRPRPHP